MFNLMKDYHKKFNSLNNLKIRRKDNEKRKKEVLNNVGDIYSELYDICKRKYNKKIYRLFLGFIAVGFAVFSKRKILV